MSDPPSLFGWGRGGVPGEFRAYVDRRDLDARLARGESVPQPRPGGFCEVGLQAIAEELSAELNGLRERRMTGKASYEANLTAPHDVRCRLHLLLAYCAFYNRPPPDVLLKLTFEVLGLGERNPSAELVAQFDTADVSSDSFDAFLRAAELDGEADARGASLSVSALAAQVKVTRDTVRRWRKASSYRRRREYCAWDAAQHDEHGRHERARRMFGTWLDGGGDGEV